MKKGEIFRSKEVNVIIESSNSRKGHSIMALKSIQTYRAAGARDPKEPRQTEDPGPTDHETPRLSLWAQDVKAQVLLLSVIW